LTRATPHINGISPPGQQWPGFSFALHIGAGLLFLPTPTQAQRDATWLLYASLASYTAMRTQRHTTHGRRRRAHTLLYIPIIIGRSAPLIIAPAPAWSVSTALHLLHRYQIPTIMPDAAQVSAEPYYNKVYKGDRRPRCTRTGSDRWQLLTLCQQYSPAGVLPCPPLLDSGQGLTVWQWVSLDRVGSQPGRGASWLSSWRRRNH